MNIGKSMKEMRDRKGLSQSNVADDLYVDQTMISKIEKNKRGTSKEIATTSVSLYADARYGFEVARETAKDYITPLATANKAIEWHRLALEEVFKRQAQEAIDHVNKERLAQKPDCINDKRA